MYICSVPELDRERFSEPDVPDAKNKPNGITASTRKRIPRIEKIRGKAIPHSSVLIVIKR